MFVAMESGGADRVPAAVFEGVSCAFPSERGASVALEDVSLTIAQGEFVCLLGPSGSGKSTLLALLAGLLRPSSGTVRGARGAIVGPGPDRAVVFQDAALFPWLTLEDNIRFPMRVQGLPEDAQGREVERLLRLVHLWRFRDRYPHELSGGMRQRGAIARALATDPAVLLMDEPFAALDTQTRERLQAETERLWMNTGKTIVFVTHSVTEAVRLADRVVLMGTRPGRVLAVLDVDLPRPRPLGDARVAALVSEAGAVIAREVDKVAREEELDGSEVEGA